jgi:hypothetical protein
LLARFRNLWYSGRGGETPNTQHRIHRTHSKHSTAFTGGGTSSCKISIGTAGTFQNSIITNFDIQQAVNDTAFQQVDPNVWTKPTDTLQATVTTTGANINALTQGSGDIMVAYISW